MAKEIRCRDVGVDCDFVAQGKDEQELMTKVGEHAKNDHGIQTIPDELLSKVKAAIHDV